MDDHVQGQYNEEAYQEELRKKIKKAVSLGFPSPMTTYVRKPKETISHG